MSALAEYDSLIAALPGEAPCGENLEDSPTLAALESLNIFGRTPQPVVENPRPEDKPPPPPPDWSAARQTAVEVLRKSKDLRGLTQLAAGALRVDGLAAGLATIGVAAHWLETWWAETYPPLEEGAVMRLNVLNAFADHVAILDGIRRAPLVASREHGRVTLRDFDLTAGTARPAEGEPVLQSGHIEAAFAAADRAGLQSLSDAVRRAVADMRRIETAMREGAGIDAAPSFEPLFELLKRIGATLDVYLKAGAATDGVGASAENTSGAAVAGVAASGPVGAVRSRQDAIRALDAVAAFFRQTEPSSPVPYFIERAKRLVAKDFLEVLNDVVPGATSSAREAIGVREP